jgi:hypothetical protein
MTVEFALVPLAWLKAHEEYDRSKVVQLVAELRKSQRFIDPIWVARGSFVILNGHHRVEALRRLGAQRAAAWLFDYDSDNVRLERWTPGPPIAKSEVVDRAVRGELFPPKTTRHRLLVELPERSVALAELFEGAGAPVVTDAARGPVREAPAAGSSRPRASAASRRAP